MIGYLAAVESDTKPETAAEDAAQYGTPPDFQWIGVERLDEQLALPAAFKSYYRIMKRYLAEGVTV